MAQTITAEFGGHQFNVIECDYRTEPLDVTSWADGGIRQFIPGPESVECVIPYRLSDYTMLRELFGQRAMFKLHCESLRIERGGVLESLQIFTANESISFSVLLDPRPRINSWWYLKGDHESRNDPVYLLVGADWHEEHGEPEISQQLRDEAERVGRGTLTR